MPFAGEVTKVFHNQQRQRWRRLQRSRKKRHKGMHPRTAGAESAGIRSEALLIRVTFFRAEFATLVTRFTRRLPALFPLTFYPDFWQ